MIKFTQLPSKVDLTSNRDDSTDGLAKNGGLGAGTGRWEAFNGSSIGFMWEKNLIKTTSHSHV